MKIFITKGDETYLNARVEAIARINDCTDELTEAMERLRGAINQDYWTRALDQIAKENASLRQRNQSLAADLGRAEMDARIWEARARRLDEELRRIEAGRPWDEKEKN